MKRACLFLAGIFMASTLAVSAQDYQAWITTEGAGVVINSGSGFIGIPYRTYYDVVPVHHHHHHHGKKAYKKYKKAQKKYYKARRKAAKKKYKELQRRGHHKGYHKHHHHHDD